MSAAEAPKPVSPLLRVGRDVFAGTCGGIAVTLVGHPFDTLKVRLQTQPTNPPIYSGVVDCLQKTIKWEGPAGLYKGVTSPLAGQMFFRATLFGAFGGSKRWLATNWDGSPRELKPIDFYKAGMITGFAAAFTEGPIDFYKSQLQVQIIKAKADPNYKPPYTSVFDCVKSTIRQNGIRGPFQSLGPTIVRNTPANAAFLGTFQLLKEKAAVHYDCKVSELPAWSVVSAAGAGGLLYWLLIYPVDVVKSAMAADSIIKGERMYPDMVTTTKKLYADGGMGRFYRGFTPCLMRAVPANSAMLFTVDKVTAWLS